MAQLVPIVCVNSSQKINPPRINLYTTVPGLKRKCLMVLSALASSVMPVIRRKLLLHRVRSEETGENNPKIVTKKL